MSVPTFIVGTGRCGSTMLSNMLREHPHVLSISEFFALITDAARSNEPFDREPMGGRRFWSIIAAITPMPSFALRHRIPCEEWLYNCDFPSTRFSRETGVPAILMTTLPHLTDDYDALYDAIGNEVLTWPTATIGEHYRRLFGWLADQFGKCHWVERSGAGLGMTEKLMTTFPDGKFLHIARDGRDAALSMEKHKALVLGVGFLKLEEILGVDPLVSADRTQVGRVPPELLPLLPERFDAQAFHDFSVPRQLCGSFWTQQIVSGLELLGDLPADRLLTLRYEDFLESPKRQLDTLAAFLGQEFIDEDWSARCAARVRQPKSTWRDLSEEDARALTEACRPGFELLREAGVEYEV